MPSLNFAEGDYLSLRNIEISNIYSVNDIAMKPVKSTSQSGKSLKEAVEYEKELIKAALEENNENCSRLKIRNYKKS